MADIKDNPHAGHRERMRQRFQDTGLDGFAEHEILEMLLFYVVRRENTNTLAHKLLTEFGSLYDVFHADRQALLRVGGVGEKIADFLLFAGAVHNHVEISRFQDLSLKSYENRCMYFHIQLSGCKEERLLLACLDDAYKVSRCFTVSSGSDAEVSLPVKKIVKLSLSTPCSRVMIAHNHPTGKAHASPEDIRSTGKLAKVLHDVETELVDHIIVSPDEVISMQQTGSYQAGLLV